MRSCILPKADHKPSSFHHNMDHNKDLEHMPVKLKKNSRNIEDNCKSKKSLKILEHMEK